MSGYVLNYDAGFDKSKLSREKIEHTDEEGIRRTHKMYMYSGDTKETGSAESYLYCLQYFETYSVKSLGLRTIEYWDKYGEVLSDIAQDYWQSSVMPKITRELPTGTRDRKYKRGIELMKQRFCGGDRARDRMLPHLYEMNKPFEVSVEAHVGRMELLMNYTNKLMGKLVPPLDEARKRDVLIMSFPDQWIGPLKSSRADYLELTMEEIQTFMMTQKQLSDEAKVKRDKRPSREDQGTNKKPKRGNRNDNNNSANNNNNNNRRRNNNSNHNQNNTRPAHMCRLHPTSNHAWSECYLNPRNPNNRLNNNNNQPRASDGGSYRGGRRNNHNNNNHYNPRPNNNNHNTQNESYYMNNRNNYNNRPSQVFFNFPRRTNVEPRPDCTMVSDTSRDDRGAQQEWTPVGPIWRTNDLQGGPGGWTPVRDITPYYPRGNNNQYRGA